ncbi:TPA: hypothetical protein DIS57_02040 [Candidatus Wolfebacteria bacterium]|nr:hypothetical protein [Candidatus Wolfebacteria bacterium]HCM52712.1 hypothetical protein [Candidatus Wolfebacteria bacterium]
MMLEIDMDILSSTVIVIGNGFDLNLGLKTSYHDFMKSRYFLDLLVTGNRLCIYLKKRENLDNWVDIESALVPFSLMEDSVNFKSELAVLKIALRNYLNHIDYGNINRRSHAYEFVRDVGMNASMILNFNYTDTVELILQEHGLHADLSKGKVTKVHGTLSNGAGIILGVEDKAEHRTGHAFIKKSSDDYFPAVNVSEYLLGAKSIYFYGHSLGKTDHMYFERFFNSVSAAAEPKKERMITMSYLKSAGNADMMEQLNKLTSNNVLILKQENIFIPLPLE